MLLQPILDEHVLVHFVLHAGNRLHATGDENVAFAGQDALRGERHGLQTREEQKRLTVMPDR